MFLVLVVLTSARSSRSFCIGKKMVAINSIQAANFKAALSVATNQAELERLAFAIWSESAGYIYANDGSNSSRSPGFDTHPQWPAILRRSLNIPHNKVGSNGRSTGMLQQISSDVGGGWGDMAGTMDPATSARRFLNALRVTDDPIYEGILQTPTGSRPVSVVLTPIAADVLRVQQPLADEAQSSNYSASQVQIAKEIAAQFGSLGIQGNLGSGLEASQQEFTYLSQLLGWK